jgi:hypothetical protein
MSTTQPLADPVDPLTLHHVALYVSDLDRTRFLLQRAGHARDQQAR